ncbi:gonadal somatic cell derived factor [Centropristis striata]|uniref:gonadal somatic cell derived factor n=1 Tax=Centropristis striata TaxID=184440 RepID=UPI0027E1C963|nr:gonadal somatic cell derived factor [Centropristis striata]
MSFSFIGMMLLLGSSVAIAFVLQPFKEEPAASPVSYHRCQAASLQAIRKDLLEALNLQVEPQLPAGSLDAIREQWRNTFSSLTHRAKDTAVPVASGYFASPDVANSASLKCCSIASEVFMKDLGWDNWVIHPASLTIVQCSPCIPAANTLQCPSSHTNVQGADSQVPCCHPTSQEMVPVLYVDEFSTLVISSVQLTRSCGCGSGNLQQPGTE